MFTKKFWFGLFAIGIPILLLAQSIRWYNDAAIPQKTVLDGSEIISIQQTGPNAYRWALLEDLRDVTSGSPTNPITFLYVSNLFVTNAYISNLFVTNLDIRGKTTFEQFITNYYFITTNIFQGNTLVSNYFVTNVFANSYVSNFINTNYFITNQYTTNLFSTNIVNNNNYVSNFWQTNILFNNTYVSNYFVTNTFNTTVTNITIVTNVALWADRDGTAVLAPDGPTNVIIGSIFEAYGPDSYNFAVGELQNLSSPKDVAVLFESADTPFFYHNSYAYWELNSANGTLFAHDTVEYDPHRLSWDRFLLANSLMDSYVGLWYDSQIKFKISGIGNLDVIKSVGYSWPSEHGYGFLKDDGLGNLSWSSELAPVTNFYFFSTNLYYNNSYVSNYFTTNVFNNSYVSNFLQTNFYTTNVYTTNLFSTNIVNNNSYVSNFWQTNIFVNDTYVSNYYVTNMFVTTATNFFDTLTAINLTVKSNAFINTLYATNVHQAETGWAGPTNKIDFGLGSVQFYLTYTPISVTNYSGTVNGFGNSVLLVITNAASTNIPMYLPTGLRLGNGATSPITVTNATLYEMWFYWSSNRFTGIGQTFN